MSGEIDYDRIERRCEAASPAPWGNQGRTVVTADGTYPADHTSLRPAPSAEKRLHADREFIAHARQDLPALLARCRELEAARAEANYLREWRDDAVRSCAERKCSLRDRELRALRAQIAALEARCEKLVGLVEEAYIEGKTNGVLDYLHLGPKPWRTSATRHTLAEIMEDSTDD